MVNGRWKMEDGKWKMVKEDLSDEVLSKKGRWKRQGFKYIGFFKGM